MQYDNKIQKLSHSFADFGRVHICTGMLGLFFLSLLKGKRIHSEKRLGGGSSLARFCFTNLQCICAVSDRLNIGPGWASSVF